MGIFDRFRSTGQALADDSGSKVGTSEQDALRLIDEGHILEAEGRIEEAMQRYLNAIRLAPNPARAHLNHGNILLAKGDLKGALDAFRTAIKHNPDYAGAYYNMGNALLGNGQIDEAVANYRRALEINPDYAEVHCSLGVAALKELGQLDNAVASFQRALQINPDLVEAHTNLDVAIRDIFSMGNVLMGNGQLDKAVASYRRVLEIKPDFAEAHTILGLALKDLGQLDGAVVSHRRALEIKPDLAEAHNNLGLALHDFGQYEDAEASFRHALGIKPDFTEAHSNLGVTLKSLGQLDGAVASYWRALEIKPDLAEAHNNLGLALQDLGQYEDAAASYQRALEIKPDFAETHFNLSLLLLSLGQYAEAWPKYEARYQPNFKGRNVILPDVTFPQWESEPLNGKSLVIWPEQGFGDEMQFVRYIPLLKIRGVSRITLVCTSPLKVLLGTLEGVDAVVSESEAASLPFHDYWTFSMSLPLHFATTVDTIPAKLPYLSAPLERLNRWHNRLPKGGLKVGLVWKGSAVHKNDANRSLPSLSILAPLWSVPGITFVSLQKGQGEDEAATPPTGQPIVHMGSGIQDFADTAAIVAQLDLVICIDTAIAHLAGALGKPCWVLLPAHGTDWRWLQERTDSPWYPGVMRLFRQTKAGDWAATISDATQALGTWVDEHRDTI
jgi:tetratricopeptide (TPR) repeat protein